MRWLPALKLEVPATLIGPVSVNAPSALTSKSPLMVDAPKFSPCVFNSDTLLPLLMTTLAKLFAELFKTRTKRFRNNFRVVDRSLP